MTDLYRRNGSAPADLPTKVYAENGDAYTAPYALGDLAMLGFVLAPEKPPATETQTAEWDGEAEAWVMVDRPSAPPAPLPTVDDINAERDRRTVFGFVFNGVRFQSRPQDRENIMGAFALASAALTVGGKAPGDLRWHGGQSDFVFIAEDDSRVPMDAVAVLGLGQAAANQKSALTFAANDLKKLDPIPADYAADAHWPPVS